MSIVRQPPQRSGDQPKGRGYPMTELTLSVSHAGIWHYASACRPDPDCLHCDDAGCPECTPERFCEHGVDLERHACTCETMTADELAEFA